MTARSRERVFNQVLVNTLLANVTINFLWFALTFWAYLQTKSVLATGVIGGSYMLLLAACAMYFGTLVDHHKKQLMMVWSSTITLLTFAAAGAVYLAVGEAAVADLGRSWFWIFVALILFGSVVESLRNIALSTTVTLLVDEDRRANANGLVGTVQGIGFIATSVFSGLAIGQLGMGWTLAISVAMTAVSAAHLFTFRIPEDKPEHGGTEKPKVDFAGALVAIKAVPGLLAMVFFATFNNLIGGVYLTLMDPYGLEMFSVEAWGLLFGVAGTGFIVGGLLIAKFGLGKNPVRTMLLVVAAMGALGAFFTIREWWWLYAVGIWLYMVLIPPVEAAEQTVIQQVVEFEQQGRVFGFAQAVESAAAPVTAFLIAPIAQFWVIPYLDSPEGAANFAWLLGHGESRGIALVFLISGLLMVLAAVWALRSKYYRILSADYLAKKAAAESKN